MCCDIHGMGTLINFTSVTFLASPVRKMNVHTASTVLWKAELCEFYQLGGYFPTSVDKKWFHSEVQCFFSHYLH